MAGLRKRDLTAADFEKIGVKALDTFETVALDLEIAAEGMFAHHEALQAQVVSLQLQQAAAHEARVKFSKAALKVRALIS